MHPMDHLGLHLLMTKTASSVLLNQSFLMTDDDIAGREIDRNIALNLFQLD